MLGGGRGHGGAPGCSNPISLCRRDCRQCFLPSEWCSSPYTPHELPKQKQAWYTSPAVLVGNCGMKWGQTTIPQRLVLAQCLHRADTLWILGCVQHILPRRCLFCLLSHPRPCFPQLCPVHGFCCRKAASCSTLLPICHLISVMFLLPVLPLPPPVSGFESLQWGYGKAS